MPQNAAVKIVTKDNHGVEWNMIRGLIKKIRTCMKLNMQELMFPTLC